MPAILARPSYLLIFYQIELLFYKIYIVKAFSVKYDHFKSVIPACRESFFSKTPQKQPIPGKPE